MTKLTRDERLEHYEDAYRILETLKRGTAGWDERGKPRASYSERLRLINAIRELREAREASVLGEVSSR